MGWINFYHISLLLVSIFFLIGMVGIFLPIVPGCAIIWAGILVHKLVMGDASISWGYFGIISGLVILVHLLDFFMTYIGVRLFGATWRGGVGAVLGLILAPLCLGVIPGIGLFTGLLIGPIVGAMVGELLGGRNGWQATKAGIGTVIGGMLALLVRFWITCFIVISFFYSLPVRM